MKEFIIPVMLVCLLRIEWTTTSKSNSDIRSRSSLNCSQYTDDDEILVSFPFHVDMNPFTRVLTKTNGLMNDEGHIYHLNIINQKFFPLTIFCLKHLQQLYIRNMSFRNTNHRLPSEIDRLASTLISLSIYNSQLTHLSEQISRLKHLQSLELVNTNLMELPYSIGNLSSLTFLYLANNQLSSLPDTIKNLSVLSQIVLKNNLYLRSIQSLNGLPNLKGLQIDNCPIEQLPMNLPYLTDFQMSKSNLSHLIGIRTLGYKTKNNKYFYFNNNHIQSIPPQIKYVNNLYFLNLNDNHLITLPLDIFNITTLHYLYIQNNHFRDYELKKIVTKFTVTHPYMTLYYTKSNS